MAATSACSILGSAFYLRVSLIQRSLGSKKDFHHREMEAQLGYAKKEAVAGDKSIMDYCCPQEATEHATKLIVYWARQLFIPKYP
jgi:hypothetical protein